jgi:NAD-dependent dihydropyrimidine dehydrogenase PreA subunit
VEYGLGREITKEETLEILKKAADAGLVHGLANQEENPETLCNCDLEYCTMFKPFHQLNFDKSMDKSNYLVESTPETCTACGLCVKRCPMDAIQLKFSPKSTNKFRKAVVVDTDLCIGCGVCVHKCKAESITLKRKEETTRPPETGRDLVSLNAMAALAAKEEEK